MLFVPISPDVSAEVMLLSIGRDPPPCWLHFRSPWPDPLLGRLTPHSQKFLTTGSWYIQWKPKVTSCLSVSFISHLELGRVVYLVVDKLRFAIELHCFPLIIKLFSLLKQELVNSQDSSYFLKADRSPIGLALNLQKHQW